jgi:predicted enzyme related to lactoylglutathione lyase
MGRVTGIGGVFFKAKDPTAMQAWYRDHLGIDVQVWGGASFDWTDPNGTVVAGTTAWRIASDEDSSFAPSTAPFMINYRVDDLPALVDALREAGSHIVDDVQGSDFGKFASVLDPEGNKVELWEPAADQ